MHSFYGDLPVLHLTMRATGGALVVHRYNYARSRCRTSQYRRTFIHLSVSVWNDLPDPLMWDWWISRAGPMIF